jgi:hypothetical protein
MSNQTNAGADRNDPPSREYLETVYTEIHNRYAGITDFRAKLLGLLPLATGTGVFLAWERAQAQTDERFLGPIGIFGLIVILGLFAYEIRGMQRCQMLEEQGKCLKKKMELEGLGPFHRPDRWLGNMLGAPAAGLIIYVATAVAWTCLAAYGLMSPGRLTWTLLVGGLVGFLVVVTASWFPLRRRLEQIRSSTPCPSDPQ